MNLMGDTVFTEAINRLLEWDAESYEVPTINVNLSLTALRDPGLADQVLAKLDQKGLTPPRLVVEIGRGILSKEVDDIVRKNLSALAQAGCGIDIDGFGVEGIALDILQSHPIRRLKIDSSLVRVADRAEDKTRVLAALNAMAAQLEIRTVATGVETIQQDSLLRDLGYDYGQGLLFAHPAPAIEISQWLHARTRARGAAEGEHLRRVK